MGVLPVLELFINLSQILGGFEIVGVLVVFFDGAVTTCFELFAGQATAGGFLKFLELIGIAHHVAHVGVLIKFLALHRGARGSILGAFDGDAVGGMVLDDVVVDVDRIVGVIQLEVESGELVKNGGVVGLSLTDGFKGEGRGIDQFKFEGGFVERVVDIVISGVLGQLLLSQHHGGFGVFFEGGVNFAGRAGAKEPLLFSLVANHLECAVAQHFTPFQKAWSLFEDALQEGDGVGMVGNLHRIDGLQPQGFCFCGEFLFRDFRHGEWGQGGRDT